MDPKKEANQIMKSADPPRKVRAHHGKWVEAAAVVIEMVDAKPKKWNIADAIRAVIAKRGYVSGPPDSPQAKVDANQAMDGIRAAYNMLRRRAAKAKGKSTTFELQ
ncbi:MAG: hypothetical protein WC718_00105 [Phycisphaerales bacterium]